MYVYYIPIFVFYNSYSPVVRKCMVEIENVMDNKMSQLMETLKDLNKDNIQHRSEIMDTPWPSTGDSVSAGPLPLALRNELKTIIQEILKENVKSNTKFSGDVNRSESILLESSLLRNDPKCQLVIFLQTLFINTYNEYLYVFSLLQVVQFSKSHLHLIKNLIVLQILLTQRNYL